MPAIVAAVAAAAVSTAATSAVVAAGVFAAGSIGAAMIGAAAATIVAGTVALVLTPKPKQASQPSVERQDAGFSTISRSSVEPMRVIYGRRKVSGVLVLAHTTQQGFASQANLNSYAPTLVTDNRDNAFLHLVIALAGHEVDAIEEVYLGDTLLTLDVNGFATNAPFQTNYVDGNGRDNGLYRFARVKTYLGTDSQTADPDLQTLFSGWTPDHRLRGVAYLYVCLRWYDRVFPNGIPNITAVVRGKKVFDPRSSTTAYSNNWALCVRDYLTNGEYGLGCSASEIDDTTLIASANICDEDVTLKAGGTQKRYTCNGVIDTSNAPLSALDAMATAAAGVVTYSQGKFQVYAGAYTSPTQTLDASWLRGNINVQAKTPRKERFNGVRGLYTEPSKQWQPTDFPAVTVASYVAADGGETIYRDLDLPFVTDAEGAQRLGRIYLESGRRAITVLLECNLKALDVRVWDTLNVTLAEYGWTAKPFRVTGWRLSVDGGIDLELKEDDANAYAWTPATATDLVATPTTNLPAPTSVAVPGAPSVSEEQYITTDGSGVKVRVNVSWADSAGPFVWRYRLEYKLTSETDYRLAVETASNVARLEDVAPGAYNFRVKAINTILAESAYSTVTNANIVGLTAPPANITGLAVVELKGSAHLSWNAPTDVDVRVGGSVRVRHSPLTTGATWSSAIDIGPQLPGIATNVVLPLLPGSYLVKAVDSTGNESTTAAVVSTELADLLAMNVVVTDTEHPSFSGTKTNMQVSSGVLQLTSGSTTGTYTFTTSGGACIDLKQVLRCRLTAKISSTIYDRSNLWDSITSTWDEISGLWDGEDITGVAVELYVRSTNDDPAGTPTWSAWRKFLIGDYEARAFQFKIEVVSNDSSKNVDIDELEVVADVPDRDERMTDVVVLATGTTVTFGTPFYTKPMIYGVIQSASANDGIEYTYNMSGGKYVSVTVFVRHSGSYVERTADFFVRGY